MSARLPLDAEEIFERGGLCYVAASTDRGPHVTPLVFAWSGGRLWLTTSRGSVKMRAWRTLPRMGGLIRHGDRAVSFSGTVRMHDLLEPSTWRSSIRDAPALTRAGSRFSRKNARFFAGYAFDARAVPLAWTPPGRVFVQVEIDRWAVLSEDAIEQVSAGWGSSVCSLEAFRGKRSGVGPLASLPAEIAAGVGEGGGGVLAVDAALGGMPVVLPVRWLPSPGAFHVGLAAELLALAGVPVPITRVALCADRASLWRATEMMGAMFQGAGEIYELRTLASGARSATAAVKSTGTDPRGAVLVRSKPERVVWWHGFESGTMMPS